MRQEIKKSIEKAIKNLQKENKIPDFNIPDISVEYPKNKDRGDYAFAVFGLAKQFKIPPMEMAEILAAEIIKNKAIKSNKKQ